MEDKKRHCGNHCMDQRQQRQLILPAGLPRLPACCPPPACLRPPAPHLVCKRAPLRPLVNDVSLHHHTAVLHGRV